MHAPGLAEALACYDLPRPHVQLVEFDPTRLPRIAVHGDRAQLGNLASPANFARFALHTLLPDPAVLYVDCDIVFTVDVRPLLAQATARLQSALVAAVPRASPTYASFDEPVRKLFLRRYGRALDPTQPTFNAGLYAVSLVQWRARGLPAEIAYWMGLNMRQRLWSLGTQPLLLLVAYRVSLSACFPCRPYPAIRCPAP